MDTVEAERLVETYAATVYRLAYARTGNPADAEDVMQEVFLRLVRSDPEFRSDEHAKAWLLRVAANCTNSLFRSPWRRRTEPLDETMPTEERERGHSEVLEAVLALPKQYRIPVHLFYFEELSVKEIAQVVGKSEQAVKSILFRARAQLRETLEGVTDYV